MKAFAKTMIAGAIIIGIGIVILLIALGLNGWSFAPDWKTEEYSSDATYTALDVRLSEGKVRIEYHDGEEFRISYPTAKGYETTITERRGELSLDANTHKWYTFSWGVVIPEIVISIPKDTVTDLSVQLNAGTVEIPDGSFKNVKIKVNAGTCTVGKISECELMNIDLNAGAVYVSGVNAARLNCYVNAGVANVRGIDCTATDAKVSAGSANLTFFGERSNYSATVDVSAGACNGLATQTGGSRNIAIKVSAGACNVNFAG